MTKIVSKCERGISERLLKTSGADVLRLQKKLIIKKTSERGLEGWVSRPRVKNPKSYNGTETNQLTLCKRGRGFTRVIQILIR